MTPKEKLEKINMVLTPMKNYLDEQMIKFAGTNGTKEAYYEGQLLVIAKVLSILEGY
jgi:hypothetical protein